MTKRRATAWAPEQDLAAVLDALSLELLATPDHEVRAVEDESPADAKREAAAVRRIVGAADADLVGRTIRHAFVAAGRPPVSRIQ